MYYVSRLSKPCMAFVSSLMASNGHRDPSYPIAVAYVLGRQLPLPAAEVTDLDAYYRLNLAEKVERDLDKLNGITPFDWKEAKRLMEAFYRHRYHTSYPPAIPLAFRKDRGVIDFFGLSTYFSDDTLKTINECPEKISSLVNKLTDLVRDLQPKQDVREEEVRDRQLVE